MGTCMFLSDKVADSTDSMWYLESSWVPKLQVSGFITRGSLSTRPTWQLQWMQKGLSLVCVLPSLQLGLMFDSGGSRAVTGAGAVSAAGSATTVAAAA